MNFEEFKNICDGRNLPNNQNYKSEDLTDCGISISWTTGGVGGGSCWDTGEKDNHYDIKGEEEPEFDELDVIFEKVCPGITFIQYKTICKEVVNTYTYGINEYYGNYTNYCEKWIDLKVLYDALISRGLLCSEE